IRHRGIADHATRPCRGTPARAAACHLDATSGAAMAKIIEMFSLTQPVLEIAVRGTIAFIVLIALIRIVPKRNAGHISPNDMLVLIVVGSLGADAVMGGASSSGDLLLMTALILAWGYVFDLLEYHLPTFRRLMQHEE